MSYDESIDGLVTRDQRGLVRRVSHPRRAFHPRAAGVGATGLASAYLREIGSELAVDTCLDQFLVSWAVHQSMSLLFNSSPKRRRASKSLDFTVFSEISSASDMSL